MAAEISSTSATDFEINKWMSRARDLGSMQVKRQFTSSRESVNAEHPPKEKRAAMTALCSISFFRGGSDFARDFDSIPGFQLWVLRISLLN